MAVKKCVFIIGCGDTGQYWDGSGESIGVNDCWKFGHPTDYLLLIDPPSRFEMPRRKIIEKSRPHHLITDSKAWLSLFYNAEKAERLKPDVMNRELYCTNGQGLIKYRFSKWTGTLHKDRIQFSHTSTFAAISLAYVLGYNEIVTYGVDFKNHRSWKEGNPHMAVELDLYKDFFRQLEKEGVSVQVGHPDSLLSKILPVAV